MNFDLKIINWIMQGAVALNKANREVDFKILSEAMLSEYKDIFQKIVDYHSKYKTPPSYDVLLENVESEEEYFLISEIQENTCEETEVLYVLDKIKTRYNLHLAKRLADSYSDSTDDIDEFNENLNRISSKIARLQKSSVFAEGDFTETVEERLNRYEYIVNNPDFAAGVKSGYREIDEYTNGIKKSELMLIVGASSSGKSLLMMNYAVNAWLGSNTPNNSDNWDKDDGCNILFFTLEMNKEQMEQRIDACMSDIKHTPLMRGTLSLDEKEKWLNSLAFQKQYKKHFYIVDMPRGSRVLDMEARYKTIVSEFQPDLIVVDYLGIMSPNQSSGQDWQDVGQVAADLHEFCRNNNIAVLSAAQKKAKQKNSKDKGNDLEDVGRSLMIAQNCNIMLLIENREDEKIRTDAVIHVVKNRDGARGEIRLYKNFEKSKFSNIPNNWATESDDENSLE